MYRKELSSMGGHSEKAFSFSIFSFSNVFYLKLG